MGLDRRSRLLKKLLHPQWPPSERPAHAAEEEACRHAASDAEVIRRYQGVCVHHLGPASGIHELVPRSTCQALGLDWQRFANRVPLCSACHDWAQVDPLGKAEGLRDEADRVLCFYGTAEPAST